MTCTLVVKVGGSLLEWAGFPQALAGYLASIPTERPLLVVGGGSIVDQLRILDATHGIGDAGSHELALWALDVTARLAESLVRGLRAVASPEEVARTFDRGEFPVFAPRGWLETADRSLADALPRRWTTTTDSIAARIAREFGSPGLVLLKSTWPGGESLDRREAARLGLVDPEFPRASEPFRRVPVVNLRQSSRTVGVLT